MSTSRNPLESRYPLISERIFERLTNVSSNCVRVSTVTDEEHLATGEHTYVEDQNAEGAFVSEANCVSGAIYKKSCEVCGALHATETFTVGTASGHNYSVEDATKEGATVSATTCSFK